MVTIFYYIIYMIYIPAKYKNCRTLLIPDPIKPHPSRNLALRARRVNAELDPAGRGKGLVGKGLCTIRARIAKVRARLA